jgi:hypothetical protein
MAGVTSASAPFSRHARSVATLVVSGVILSAPSIYNRYPLLFPDSVSYLVSRDALADLVRPDNIRPVLLPICLANGLAVKNSNIVRLSAPICARLTS